MSTIANGDNCCNSSIDGTSASETVIGTDFESGDGTALLPAYSFTSDPDTGMYRVSSNTLGFSVGGTLTAEISSAVIKSFGGFVATTGALATPHYRFNSDPDTGIFNPTADTLGLVAGGVQQLTLNTTNLTSTVPIIGTRAQLAFGTAAAPALCFTGNTNTGIYLPSANVINFSLAGVNYLDIRQSYVGPAVQFRTPGLSAAGPSYAFNPDANTGMYSPGADQIGWATNGIMRATLSDTLLNAVVPITSNGLITGNILSSTAHIASGSYVQSTTYIISNDGTIAAPAYRFANAGTTGFYSPGTNQVGITNNGSSTALFTTTAITFTKPISNNQQPYAFFYKSANQAASGGPNLVSFDTLEQSQNSPVSNASGVFTINSAGVYSISYYVATSSNGSGARTCIVSINEAPPTTSYARNGITSTYTEVSGHFDRLLAVNDVVRLYYYSPDAVNLSGSATGNRCTISFTRLC